MESTTPSSIQTISIKEFGLSIGRKEKTIHNKRSLIAMGKLPADELPPSIFNGREVRYSIAAVEAWFKQREAAAIQKAIAAQPVVKRGPGRPRKKVDSVGRIQLA